MIDAFGFVGGAGVLVGGVVGLVPDVPGEDAGIVGEGADDAFDVGFEGGFGGGVSELFDAGALDPAGVLSAGAGGGRRPGLGGGVPAGGVMSSLMGGLWPQPELCTPGMWGCCGPGVGLGSQQESKSTNIWRMPWRA